jgi:hypothetical protein
LLVALSVALLAFWAIGDLLSPPPDVGSDPFRALSQRLATGLLANLGLALLIPSLAAATAATLALGAIGLIRALPRLRGLRHPSFARAAVALLGVAVLVLLGVRALAQPLADWDARLVWFFQSRMIWLDDSLRVASHWTDPGLQWAHPDYPKMVPLLGAQVSRALGFWNETAPKGSLVLLLAAPTASAMSFVRRGIAFPLLIAGLFLTTGQFLFNGYVDAFVALYAACALLHLGTALGDRRPGDLLSGAALLGMAASLKNEGVLFALSAVLATSAAAAAMERHAPGSGVSTLAALVRNPRHWPALAVSAAPAIIWWTLRARWGLPTDWHFDRVTVARFWARLTDGHSVGHVVTALGAGSPALWKTALVIAALLAWARARRIPLTSPDLLPLAAAVVSFAGMTLVYLMTPFEMEWHLATSADRTMMTVLLSAMAGAAVLVRRVEAPR